ncbi:hypothetical protein GCM10009608_24330 [Pseudonocardia alaniniphila]
MFGADRHRVLPHGRGRFATDSDDYFTPTRQPRPRALLGRGRVEEHERRSRPMGTGLRRVDGAVEVTPCCCGQPQDGVEQIGV